MQTLGLASNPQPTDSMFKRLFWPDIENTSDLDLVSQQGFWVCAVIGTLSFVILLVQHQAFVGLLVFFTYALGATGVRERSIAAAILIFVCYTVDRLSGFMMGQPPIGIIPIASFLLLLTNVRATILAYLWKRRGALEQMEEYERPSDSFTDKLSSTLPAKVWPVGRFVFFPLASLLLLLTVVGILMYPKMHERQLQLQRQQLEDQNITVTPEGK